MAGFTRYHFHALDREMAGIGATAVPAGAPAIPTVTFHTDEAAARHYLDALWSGEKEQPALLAATAPESPEVMPDLSVAAIKPSPVADNTVVQFAQSANNIPILGGKAT